MQEAQTAPGVFPVRESEQWLIVRNGMIELGFSKSNGQLGYVADAVSGRVVRIAGKLFPERGRAGRRRLIPLPPNYPHFYTDQPQEVQAWGAESRYLGYDVVRLPDGARFGISFGDARWRIEQQVTLKTRSPFARIDWKVTCCGESGTKLRKLVFRLPEIHDGAAGEPAGGIRAAGHGSTGNAVSDLFQIRGVSAEQGRYPDARRMGDGPAFHVIEQMYKSFRSS